MSLPEKRIKKIALPGDVEGSNTYEIVPDKLGNNGFSADLPILDADSTIALTDDIPHNAILDYDTFLSTSEFGTSDAEAFAALIAWGVVPAITEYKSIKGKLLSLSEYEEVMKAPGLTLTSDTFDGYDGQAHPGEKRLASVSSIEMVPNDDVVSCVFASNDWGAFVLPPDDWGGEDQQALILATEFTFGAGSLKFDFTAAEEQPIDLDQGGTPEITLLIGKLIKPKKLYKKEITLDQFNALSAMSPSADPNVPAYRLKSFWYTVPGESLLVSSAISAKMGLLYPIYLSDNCIFLMSQDYEAEKLYLSCYLMESSLSTLAPYYSSSATYAVGDHVLYFGQVYECITTISTAEPFNSAKWTAISLTALIDAKQDLLVSGTNIKTVNNESLLGSGNLQIQSKADLRVVDSLPAVGEEDVIYLLNSNVASSGDLIEFPRATAADEGKAYVIDENGDVILDAIEGGVTSVNGETGAVVLDKTDIGLGNVDNTSDLNKPISTATQTALDGKVDKVTGKGLSTEDYTTAEKTKLSGIESGAQVNVQSDWNAVSGDAQILNKPTLGSAAAKDVGTSAGNVPVLDSNGKIDTSVLPAIAISETFTAASEAAMLALNAQVGDVCIRTDETKTYILVATPASTLANWKLLEHPTDAVSSVNGKTGVVTLNAADVGAATSGHTHSYTPAGSVGLEGNDTASGGVAYVTAVAGTGVSGTPTVRYLHKSVSDVAPNSHTHDVVVSGTTAADASSAVSAVTGYPNFSGGSGSLQSFAAASGGTADISSGRIPYVTGTFNETTGVLDLVVKYLDHTHTAAALGSPSTGNAAASGHTHGYGSATAITTGANSGSAVSALTGIASNTTSASGDIEFLESYAVSGGAVDVTSKYMHASFTGTPGDTGDPE